MLETEKTEEVTGHAEVRKIFKISRVGTISGCMVTDGVIERANRLRLIRDGVVVLANAPMDGLRREKDDVRDVRAGFECGIKVHGFDDTKPGDVIETFKIVERRRTLATK
jgi:translation initiation factor IF-2